MRLGAGESCAGAHTVARQTQPTWDLRGRGAFDLRDHPSQGEGDVDTVKQMF